MNKPNLYMYARNKVSKLIANIMFGTGIVIDISVLFYIIAAIGTEGYFSTLLCSIIIFFPLGTVLIYFGNKRKIKIKLIEEYLKYINARRNINMDALCQKIGVTKEKAIEDITKLININMIDGYIDETDSLILNEYEQIEENREKKENEKTIIIKCTECGAKNTVSIGVPKECMYCGSILQDKNNSKV